MKNVPRPTDSRILRNALYQRLQFEEKPIHRNDLYQHLVNLGIHVNGDNPVNNMTAHMSNDARFESVGEGMWGLYEWTHIEMPTYMLDDDRLGANHPEKAPVRNRSKQAGMDPDDLPF